MISSTHSRFSPSASMRAQQVVDARPRPAPRQVAGVERLLGQRGLEGLRSPPAKQRRRQVEAQAGLRRARSGPIQPERLPGRSGLDQHRVDVAQPRLAAGDAEGRSSCLGLVARGAPRSGGRQALRRRGPPPSPWPPGSSTWRRRGSPGPRRLLADSRREERQPARAASERLRRRPGRAVGEEQDPSAGRPTSLRAAASGPGQVGARAPGAARAARRGPPRWPRGSAGLERDAGGRRRGRRGRARSGPPARATEAPAPAARRRSRARPSDGSATCRRGWPG